EYRRLDSLSALETRECGTGWIGAGVSQSRRTVRPRELMTRAACSTLGTKSRSRRTNTPGGAEELCNQSNRQRVMNPAVHSWQALLLLPACLLLPFSVMAGSL